MLQIACNRVNNSLKHKRLQPVFDLKIDSAEHDIAINNELEDLEV